MGIEKLQVLFLILTLLLCAGCISGGGGGGGADLWDGGADSGSSFGGDDSSGYIPGGHAPEPATFLLLGSGFFSWLAWQKMKKKK